jgi:hypothetical protein
MSLNSLDLFGDPAITTPRLKDDLPRSLLNLSVLRLSQPIDGGDKIADSGEAENTRGDGRRYRLPIFSRTSCGRLRRMIQRNCGQSLTIERVFGRWCRCRHFGDNARRQTCIRCARTTRKLNFGRLPNARTTTRKLMTAMLEISRSAGVAELADAAGLGPAVGNHLGVRVPSPAPTLKLCR